MRLRASVPILAAAAAAMAPAPAAARTSSFLIYACTGRHDYDTELCRVDADGRNRRRLTHDAEGKAPNYLAPSLSADSKRLVFVRYYDGVYVAAPDASHRRRVASGFVIDAAVSPSGRRVAYVEDAEDHATTTLWTVNADGSNRHRVGTALKHPAWLGSELLAVPGNGGYFGPRLCVVDERNGTCGRTVAKRPRSELGASAVSADGRAVAAESTNPDGTITSDGIFAFATATGRLMRPLVYGSVPKDPAWGPTRAAYAYDDNGIYLREPRVDGAGYPVDKGADGDVVDPVWGGTMGDRNPKLRIISLHVKGHRLTVRGKIARKARGLVRADFEALDGLPSRFGRTYWHRPRAGRFKFSHEIARPCFVFLGYAGDKTYSWDNASRETTAGQCPG